jgi:hypothetical protein
MENRKGGWCPYSNDLFCQEGYCEECCIGRQQIIRLKGKARQVFKYMELVAGIVWLEEEFG